MEHLTIDQEKCISCNRCVQDCPMGIPILGDDGIYKTNEANSEICIYCGHCVTVCPTKALTLNAITNEENLKEMENYGIIPFDLKPEDCIPSRLKEMPTAEQMEALIMSRRMTRSFKPGLVDRKIVDHIIKDVLCYTSTGHNTRGYKALVIEGRDKLEKLTDLSLEYFEQLIASGVLHSFDQKVFQKMVDAWKVGLDRVFRTANEAVVIYCKSSIVPADPAVKVMLTYFEVLARSMGIGTVWAGYFMVAGNYPPIKKLLGIAEDETIYGAMMFGYPEFEYDLIPKRPEIELKYI